MVYEPQEDSFLLKEFVAKHARGAVLDMGTGSGIQAREAAHSVKVKKVVAVDIDKQALAFAKEHGDNAGHKKITFVQSDLFNAFSKVKFAHYFDTLIFNAPYLPQESPTRHIDLEGGKLGHETIERFLQAATHFLKKDGIILLVSSSLTPHVQDLIERNLFVGEELGRKHVLFEDIIVSLIKPAPFVAEVEKRGVCCTNYLAQGKRGIIFLGKYRKKVVAIKVKRESTEALDPVTREANMLKEVNKHGIGPKFLFKTDHALVYEFVEGTMLKDITKKEQLKRVAMKVFEQCIILDKLGINKKEMTRPYKHVIIKGNKITLIDFERATKGEDMHNVSQFCQFARNNIVRSKRWINISREYKMNPSKDVLKKIRGLLYG